MREKIRFTFVLYLERNEKRRLLGGLPLYELTSKATHMGSIIDSQCSNENHLIFILAQYNISKLFDFHSLQCLFISFHLSKFQRAYLYPTISLLHSLVLYSCLHKFQ